MATQQASPKLTVEEYLTIERNAEHRSEYQNGEIFAMVGASQAHNLIVTNLVVELGGQLKKRSCKLFSNDMRIKVSPTGLYTYPDVVVVCGKDHYDDQQRDTLLNPTLIIEVLSESTKDYDRGEKFQHYRQLESLQEYVLIAQKLSHVEHFQRQSDNQWLLSETNNQADTILLTSIKCKLELVDIYHKVN